MAKRYYVTEDDRWPTLRLNEGDGAGYEIPPALVRRFKRTEKAFSDAEVALEEYLKTQGWTND